MASPGFLKNFSKNLGGGMRSAILYAGSAGARFGGSTGFDTAIVPRAIGTRDHITIRR